MAEVKFGNQANEYNILCVFLLPFLALRSWSAWEIALRCVDCGAGLRYCTDGNGTPITDTSYRRAFCFYCGRSGTAAVPWVGRFKGYGGSFMEWQWIPEEKLPPDLKELLRKTKPDPIFEAAVEAEVKKRLNAEFDARVKAAVEVELEVRRAK